jgi:hypothetical protein
MCMCVYCAGAAEREDATRARQGMCAPRFPTGTPGPWSRAGHLRKTATAWRFVGPPLTTGVVRGPNGRSPHLCGIVGGRLHGCLILIGRLVAHGVEERIEWLVEGRVGRRVEEGFGPKTTPGRPGSERNVLGARGVTGGSLLILSIWVVLMLLDARAGATGVCPGGSAAVVAASVRQFDEEEWKEANPGGRLDRDERNGAVFLASSAITVDFSRSITARRPHR